MRLYRDRVNIQCCKLERDKETAIQWEKLSHKRRMVLKGFKYFTRLKTIKYRVPVEEIDTKDKLAEFVRLNYGFGEFHVMFYSFHVRSKRYNSQFVCRKGCKRRKLVGAVCKHNKKYVNAFTPRATVIIEPNDDAFSEQDYRYKWISYSDGKQRDKMYMLWFWKGDGRRKKKTVEEEGLKIVSGSSVADEIFNKE